MLPARTTTISTAIATTHGQDVEERRGSWLVAGVAGAGRGGPLPSVVPLSAPSHGQKTSRLLAGCGSGGRFAGDCLRQFELLDVALGIRNSGLCDQRYEPVSFARYGLYEGGILRIVFESVANLPDRTVDAAVRIEEDIFPPDPLDYVFSGDELPPALDEEEQNVQGDSLQL